MYLGQLGKLIQSNQAWELFKDLFGDKKRFAGMLEGIYPVRNDIAHFAEVPEKELLRCKLACDDILVMIGQAVDGGGP